MPYYKPCPLCGAALDPGERCDCQDRQNPYKRHTKNAQKTAPSAVNTESGKVEIGLPTNISTSILTKEQEEIKHEY